MRSLDGRGEVQILLLWHSAGMPSEEEREAALAAFRAGLDDLLDWESALYKKSRVLLNT